jgi:putative nucleotidyltransferase with HDIG domain
MISTNEPPSRRFRRIRLPAGTQTSVRVRLLIYFVVGVLLYLMMMNAVLPKQYELSPGSISTETIVSPVTKVDSEATEAARKQAADAVEKQYRRDDELTGILIERLDRIFTDARRIVADTSLTEQQKIKSVRELIPYRLSDAFYTQLVRTSPDQLTEMRFVSREIARNILSSGVRQTELEQKRNEVDRELLASSINAQSRSVIRELVRASIVPNEFYDEARTKALREAAWDSVEPVPIKKGQIIVSAGEVITPDQHRKLKELGLIQDYTNPWPHLGLGLFVLLLLVMLYGFVHRYQPEVHRDNARLLMLATIVLLTAAGMKVVAVGQNLEWSTLGYLAPVAFGTMLITLLLDIHLALSCAVLFAILASVMFNTESHLLFDFRYGLVSLVIGMAGAWGLSGVHNRTSILRAGLIASLASLVPITAVFLLAPIESGWGDWFWSIGFGFASGLFSAVLTIGFLPYFETVFEILSPLRLLELSNPNHPLLRKLLIETPGTYHHSIIVGNLSEAAAEAIGANGLLARVGAYYHDIGKTKRPQFFIENQMGENPHDKLSPNLSKTIILSHPKDGVEMLAEHGIPKPIRDIAAQHHGTTLLKYFYHKAMKQSDGGKVLEEDYRYPGPKAQFKEAAIVGIADCVEAAVRSLARPTPARIEGIVRKIIQDRLEDGQFNECDLTLKELDVIARSMCETLNGIFHSRIEYPDEWPNKGVKQA